MTFARKRNTRANSWVRPYSLRYTAPRMPSGTATKVAMSVMTAVPMIAAFIPGPGRRGDSWMSLVNHLGNEPDTIDQPLATTVMRTRSKTNPTTITASAISTVMTMFLVRRLPEMAVRSAASSRVRGGSWAVTTAISGPLDAFGSPAHDGGRGEVDDNRDDEQRQAHRDQRAPLDLRRGLAPLERDDRRQRVTG